MQVFMPHPSLKDSISCLDNKRLGNQVYRECLTLIRGGWQNHPVAKIWSNYKHALARYALFGLEELKKRGRYYPHHYETFIRFLDENKDNGTPKIIENPKFCASHRAALLFKNFSYYSNFCWTEEPKIEYYWG